MHRTAARFDRNAIRPIRWGCCLPVVAASPVGAAERVGALPADPGWTIVWLAVLAVLVGAGYWHHRRSVRQKTAELRRELLERQLAEKELLASEQQLRQSLAEKESLLKEIHHRVKNNLQIVSSLLYLQESRVQDANGVDMLRESQNRVKSMALIHEQLYGTGDLAHIDFGRYVDGLIINLCDAYGVDTNRIRINFHADAIALGLDLAVPCGLIINELVSNSFKHAFPPGRGGTVDVVVNRLGDGHLELVVADDGIGIADPNTNTDQNGLGLRLVDTLITQLDGRRDVQTKPGTRFSIMLKDAGPTAEEQ